MGWDNGLGVWPEAVLLASTEAEVVELAWRMVTEGVDGPLRELWWGELMGKAGREETRVWLREMRGWSGGGIGKDG